MLSLNSSVPAHSLKCITFALHTLDPLKFQTLSPDPPPTTNFFSATVVHNVVFTECKRVREMDVKELLKVERYTIKELLLSV